MTISTLFEIMWMRIRPLPVARPSNKRPREDDHEDQGAFKYVKRS